MTSLVLLPAVPTLLVTLLLEPSWMTPLMVVCTRNTSLVPASETHAHMKAHSARVNATRHNNFMNEFSNPPLRKSSALHHFKFRCLDRAQFLGPSQKSAQNIMSHLDRR